MSSFGPAEGVDGSKRPPEFPALRVLRHPLLIIAALVGGVILGLYVHDFSVSLKPAADVYRFLLQMTLIPILVAAVVSGVARLVEQPHSARVLLRTFVFLVIAFVVVGAIAVGTAMVGHPAGGISEQNAAYLSGLIRGSSQGTDLSMSLSGPVPARAKSSLLDLLTGVVPRNIFASLSTGSVVQTVVFALFLGLAIGLLRERQREYLVDIAIKILDAFKRVNLWLIYALPLGAVFIVSYEIASSGTRILDSIVRFVLVISAAVVASVLVFFAALWMRSRRPLTAVISALVEPLTYSFITANSLIAVPYGIRAVEERFGCRSDLAAATVPFTMVIGRVGYLLYFIVAGVFIANFYNVPLIASDYVILAAGSAIAALATSGTVGAAALGLLSLALGPLGLPSDPAIVVFMGADVVIAPMVSMLEALANVTVSVFIGLRSQRDERVAGSERPERRITLRVSMVTLIASLIVLTGLVTIGLTYSAQRRDISYLADGMIQEISARVVQRTGNYFSPAERADAGLQYLLERGLVNPSDRTSLVDVMRNEVTDNPEFAAVYFGDQSGNFTMVKRMPDGSLSIRLITRTENSVVVKWEHTNPDYASAFPDSVDSLSQGYDPRSRGWYQDAVRSGHQIWTNVYLFASDNMLGVSNAIPVLRDGKPIGVLAVDIGLSELSYFLGSLDVAENGKAYILDEKNELVALSVPRGSDLAALFSGAPTGSAQSTANLVPADEASDPLVRRSFLSYLRASDKAQSYVFQSNTTRYLGSVVNFPNSASFNWKIGIVIPESQIYGYVNETSRIVLYAAILIIIVAIGLGVNFSRTITHPLRQLSREMARIRNFDLGGHEDIRSRITEVHNMAGAFSDMKHGLSAFNKYVPSKLVAELLRLGEEPKIGGQRKNLTLLFSDIADFTTISEKLSPEELVDEMAVYFSALGNVIMKNRGTVDKYIGDAIMAFWNAPAPVDDHPTLACLTALSCQEILRELSRGGPIDPHAIGNGHAQPGHPHRGKVMAASLFKARTRMGIHTGEVIVGNMGSEERLNYTAVGDSVNLASRLEGLNKFYGTRVIASETTYAAAKHAVVARLLDRVAVKGRHRGIEIYELLGKAGETTREDVDFANAATRAVDSYLSGKFEQSLTLIAQAEKYHPDDRALSIVATRCREYIASSPDPGWDGVFVHHEK